MSAAPTNSSGLTAAQKLVAVVSVLAIIASSVWIYRREFGPSQINLKMHQAVGQALAQETARALGHTGTVVIVTMEAGSAAEIKAQVAAFEKELKLLGAISVKDTVVLDPGDNPKYRPGSGLSAKRFLKIARKHQSAGAIVSFVGAPGLSDEDLAQMKSFPKFIAETPSPEQFVSLFDKRILLAAVVPRYEFPAPGPKKPRPGKDWFDRYFQVIAPDSALPKPDEVP